MIISMNMARNKTPLRVGRKKSSPPASRLTDLHNLPGHLIRRCTQIAISIFVEECGAYDLTPPQYSVLAMLRQRPGLDQATLASLTAIDRSTAGNVLRRLEARGHVARKPGNQDRRTKTLCLTPAGVRLLESVSEAIDRAQRRILAPLDASERTEFLRLLSKLVEINNQFSRAPLHPQKRSE